MSPRPGLARREARGCSYQARRVNPIKQDHRCCSCRKSHAFQQCGTAAPYERGSHHSRSRASRQDAERSDAGRVSGALPRERSQAAGCAMPAWRRPIERSTSPGHEHTAVRNGRLVAGRNRRRACRIGGAGLGMPVVLIVPLAAGSYVSRGQRGTSSHASRRSSAVRAPAQPPTTPGHHRALARPPDRERRMVVAMVGTSAAVRARQRGATHDRRNRCCHGAACPHARSTARRRQLARAQRRPTPWRQPPRAAPTAASNGNIA
jgi:hypothetical protein